ncbi:tryptophan 2,3-dioxygenase-like isoform X1 [Saccostrea cucullata]|uniref:tryptophan 2,3-dioxygenase-like isoform X1 n=2 Tax=Saccostrea cuccullata TaxID=36930 RepID=UPI002ED0AF79
MFLLRNDIQLECHWLQIIWIRIFKIYQHFKTRNHYNLLNVYTVEVSLSDMSDTELTYDSYLGLDKLLHCQDLETEKAGNKVDEEHLFIIVHQVFELWFKQILVDLRTIVGTFPKLDVKNRDFAGIPSKLGRIILILKLIIGHFEIIETMPPATFLNFRKYLKSGSGFQSLQFRLIENTLGLLKETRKAHKQGKDYTDEFNATQRVEAEKSEKGPSLFAVFENWLERIFREFVDDKKTYCDGLEKMVDAWSKDAGNQCDKDALMGIIEEKKYEKSGKRLSYEAFHGALLISLYQEDPEFQKAYETIKLVMDVDALVSKWRHSHVLMVHRMLGKKTGTGGTSGYDYLKKTNEDDYRVFIELFHLSAFLIPYEYKPKAALYKQGE